MNKRCAQWKTKRDPTKEWQVKGKEATVQMCKHSGLTGGCFLKILEIELAFFLESLDPYWSGKNEKRLSEGHFVCFSRVSKWQFFNFQCKYDTLHIFNKTMQDRKFWRVTLKFLVNLDPFTNSCVAVFCENAYFWRNEAKKNGKKIQKMANMCFFNATITKLHSFQ